MKNTQKDINWITAVLDHDISELKETLEAVQVRSVYAAMKPMRR